MELKTNRLTLRLYQLDDRDDLFEIFSDATIARYLLGEPWSEDVRAGKIVTRMAQNDLKKARVLSLACVYQGKVIGDLEARLVDMPETVEIGYVFHRSFHGQGLASEALEAMLGYLFQQEKVHRVFANLDARNQTSANLCHRVGLRQEAHFLQDYWSKGEWTDSYVYAILAEEWFDKKNDYSL